MTRLVRTPSGSTAEVFEIPRHSRRGTSGRSQEVWDLPDEKNAREHPRRRQLRPEPTPTRSWGTAPTTAPTKVFKPVSGFMGVYTAAYNTIVPMDNASGNQPVGHNKPAEATASVRPSSHAATDRSRLEGWAFVRFVSSWRRDGLRSLGSARWPTYRQRGSGHGQKKAFPEQRMVLTTGGDGSGGGGPNDQDAQTGL